MSEVIVRFAPSPTGTLHLGGARTALYNWLFARHHGGRFLLRIEDTDVKRSTQASAEAILDGLTWLGIDWDGDIVYQSKGLDRHRELIYRLLGEGKAYRCACTPQELQEKRAKAEKAGLEPKYDRTCRNRDVPDNVPHAIRFKAPLAAETSFKDTLRGAITVPNSELDDVIILRSNGMPTYNFSVVVDDHDMEITHIVRGDDHLTNTPRQIKIYEALGWAPPVFAHLPLIAGLSKRKGSNAVQDYREKGFLPAAVTNYIVRMGWGWKDQEVFTLDELVEKFRIEDVGKSLGRLNDEKLLWLNGQHIRLMPLAEFVRMVEPQVLSRGWSIPSAAWLAKAVESIQVRCTTMEDAAPKLEFYFVDAIEIDEKLRQKFLGEDKKELLLKLSSFLQNADFEREKLEAAVKDFLDEESIKLKAIAQPARVALSGRKDGPGLFEMMEILGKEKVARRLEAAART